MSKRKLGIATMVVVFFGLVLIQVATVSRQRLPPAITLPDGSTLQLVQVGYGEEHIPPGKWWYAFTRHLSVEWQDRLNMRNVRSMSTSEPSLGLWFRCSTNGGRYGWDTSFVDDHGIEVPVELAASTSEETSEGFEWQGLAFRAFPRRGAGMTLRLYQGKPTGGRTLAGEFRFTNPVQAKYPVWSPARTPTAVTNGDLRIELNYLEVGTSWGEPLKIAPPDGEPMAQALFSLTERGLPARIWQVDTIETSDATGNVARHSGGGPYSRWGQDYLAWRPYLWPGETAWKVRLELTRNELAAFSTNELIVVTGLALPPTNGVTELNLVTNRLGHTVTVLGLSQGNGRYEKRYNISSGIATRIDVEMSPSTTRKRLTAINLHDDQGRSIKTKAQVTSVHHGSGFMKFAFECLPPPDAKTLDFTLVLQEIVNAEFVLKPLNLLRTNAPAGPAPRQAQGK